MPRYYPISLDLSGKLCLVVGGGAVAERKVAGLLDAGARVRVISPELTPTLQALADAQRIEVLLAPYETACLADAGLVFAATNRREVNARVAQEAGARGLLVNVADAPEASSFHVPALIRRGDFCLSISTGGKNPLLAARLSDELETRFGPEYGAFVELLGQMRDYIKGMTDLPPLRHRALERLLDAENELCALLRASEGDAARTYAEALIREVLE
ncbi:MAG TPA: bifunctional precorrin-2 dehydrogenase/sirohydrochlorin ferrochelatase [Chthonomonadaceae bacterium]|nr:bifunctional precorrin-2 dehydrogenase/sirohydrochlorin ferrochelatase [Chthonomonadaceae bacterium]